MHARLQFVTECLKTEINDQLKFSLEEDRERLIFLLLHGIDAKKGIRRQLEDLYQSSSQEITWKSLKLALPYLRSDNHRLIRDFSNVSGAVVAVSQWTGVVLLVLGALMGGLTLWATWSTLIGKPQPWLSFAVEAALLFSLGLVYVRMALPLAIAKRLQPLLPERTVLPQADAVPQSPNSPHS
ncbi:hypothetical protein [Deinococcus sonorensis]|uniref:Uncharacterized protein n=1 Tax=Deinococcus sonorensis TaxID=309891 RepID=A0ABV8YBR4_9DEIO